MAEKKIITVIGATGAQGGGLVRAILNDPKGEFAVRAVTRTPDSDKAKKLADQGAEIMQGDISDPNRLKKAFDGAYGAFCVTFFWDHFSAEREMEEARIMAEAAKTAGLKHVIWSTLEDTRKLVPLDDDRMPTLQGKYKVPHFDGKGEADKFFNESGVPTTYLIASFYWENFIYFGSGPKNDQNGKFALTLPLGDKKLAGIAAEDIGKCAYGIFKAGDKYIGKTVGIAGEHLSGKEMAEKMSNALGKEVYYNEVTPDVFRGFGFPGADDVGNMFQFYRDFEEEGLKIRNIDESRSLNPDLQSLDEWLSENKNKIPLE
jgi:uncharacterized protein YbjT (DUF2867 family)